MSNCPKTKDYAWGKLGLTVKSKIHLTLEHHRLELHGSTYTRIFFLSIANIAVHFCSWLNPQMQKASHKLLRNFWLLYNWPHPNFLHCSRVNSISNSLWTFKYEGKGYLKLRYRRPWEGKSYPRGHRGCVSGRGRGEVAYKSGLLSTLLTFPHPFSLFPLQAASLSCHHL